MRAIGRHAPGQVCKEAAITRVTYGFLVVALFASACGKPAANSAQIIPSKPPEQKPLLPVLHTGAGEFTKREETGKRDIVWLIKWQSGMIQMEGENGLKGDLTTASGFFYEQNVQKSSFVSDRAHADKQQDTLTLSGNVKVVSLTNKTTLRCDSVAWTSSNKKVVAKGNVSVVSEGYSMSNVPELWANSDLSQVATPDLFNK